MSDQPTHPDRLHLKVLPNSGKVDQLREEFRMSTPPSQSPTPAPQTPPAPHVETIAQKLLKGRIIEAISTIFDPEIPVNIYELGLIYEINLDPENNAHVKMTLTAPGCPVAGTLPGEVEKKVESVDEVKSATVELVWEPAWDRSKMSESAMLQLGFI